MQMKFTTRYTYMLITAWKSLSFIWIFTFGIGFADLLQIPICNWVVACIYEKKKENLLSPKNWQQGVSDSWTSTDQQKQLPWYQICLLDTGICSEWCLTVLKNAKEKQEKKASKEQKD